MLFTSVISAAVTSFRVFVLSLDHILFGDTESPTVHLYRRGADGLWHDAVLKDLDAVVKFEKLKITVPLRDIYEGLQFRPNRSSCSFRRKTTSRTATSRRPDGR